MENTEHIEGSAWNMDVQANRKATSFYETLSRMGKIVGGILAIGGICYLNNSIHTSNQEEIAPYVQKYELAQQKMQSGNTNEAVRIARETLSDLRNLQDKNDMFTVGGDLEKNLKLFISNNL